MGRKRRWQEVPGWEKAGIRFPKPLRRNSLFSPRFSVGAGDADICTLYVENVFTLATGLP